MTKVLFFINAFILLAVNLSGQTLSPKRGIAGDLLDNNDCIAVDNYLTWYYNWANTPNAAVINTEQNYLEYAPMLWNGSWNATALTNYLNVHPEVKYLLTFNEPNLTGQANMTPAQAASLWPQVEAIANTYNLKIVSPAMTYCASGCLAPYNTGANSGTDWLDAFFAACPGCRVDYIGLHVYDTWYYGFTGNIGNATTGYKKYGKPIWLTEFAHGGLNSTPAAIHAALMVDAIDYMEQDPMIFRYAWFIARSSGANTQDILTQTTGGFTNLGLIYTHMSSYDQLFYHNVNAVIEAEHYIDKSVTYCGWNGSACTWPYSVRLEATTDGSGVLDAYNFLSSTDDTIFYNVNIPTTQSYTIDFRVNSTAASTISVHTYPGNALLGTTASLNTAGSWSTKTLSGVTMSAGNQKIYLTANNGTPLKLNWLRINCAASCGTLPVELTKFDARKLSSNSVRLEWETVSEKNNKEFIIERSLDGVQFNVIGHLAGNNTSSQTKEYTYTDLNVSGPEIYYKLKQMDINGNYFYSEVRIVSMEQNSISLQGNTIVSHLSTGQEIQYTIVSQLGQLVGEGVYEAAAGTSEKIIPIERLAEGVYFVKVASANKVFSGKIIK
jgi:hypothetical protein